MTDSSATSAAAAPPPLDEAELATLRRGLVARYAPADSIEEHWIEELVFCAWRQKRLRRIEAAALTRLTAGDLEGPSLETLRRYGARIERDWRRAMVELETLRTARPSEATGPSKWNAAQLRWLGAYAERLEPGNDRAPAPAAPAPAAPAPAAVAPQRRTAPAVPPRPAAPAAPAPAHRPPTGTNEPGPHPTADATALDRSARSCLATVERRLAGTSS